MRLAGGKQGTLFTIEHHAKRPVGGAGGDVSISGGGAIRSR